MEKELLDAVATLRPCWNKNYGRGSVRQTADIQAMKEGKVTKTQMSWFSGGHGKHLKAIDSPLG